MHAGEDLGDDWWEWAIQAVSGEPSSAYWPGISAESS